MDPPIHPSPTVLITPTDISFGDSKSLVEVGTFLSEEMNINGWSNKCSNILKENPKYLFLYDQFEYILGNAFGSHSVKIAYNPLYIQCLHPKCIGATHCNKPVKLKYMFVLKPFLDHLRSHYDRIGDAMRIRFDAIESNKFITEEQLDKLALSPYKLMKEDIQLGFKAVEYINKFAINRSFIENYTCHWKNILVNNGVIDSSLLTFQEDDARVFMALNYPNPIPDWSMYGTLFWYGLKMITSETASAVNLYRGTTKYPRFNKGQTQDMKSFMKDLNHPTAGVSTLKRFLPSESNDNEQFHPTDIIFHLNLLEKCKDSLRLEYDSCTRYPVVLGADEQEINPGTYPADGLLHGLSKPLTPSDLRQIGLDNLPHHINNSNHYITAVREYHVTDLKSCLTSNVFTSFLSGSMSTEECKEALKKISKLTNTCLSCLHTGEECYYAKLNDLCTSCSNSGSNCISLVNMLTLWDMGSSHKSTAKTMSTIDTDSTFDEYMCSDLFGIAFGGLHLCKALINTARCYSITHNGENFGVYILRALKHGGDNAADLLTNIKNAVLVGKDRQSDYLAYMTCSNIVQNALKEKDVYSLIRVPEMILDYKENAKTQKTILNPVAVQTNLNGDVFILDEDAACIHIYDRADVAREYVIGKYMSPNVTSYDPEREELAASEVKFSASLKSLSINNDRAYIADYERGEIIIIKNCR